MGRRRPSHGGVFAIDDSDVADLSRLGQANNVVPARIVATVGADDEATGETNVGAGLQYADQPQQVRHARYI
ncbi:MAG TPA: hypothetical protein VNI35_04990 [Nitrospira sp.]|nr:hypothetical protein [Nitrospira sp.]